jgi:hypothetical protein
LRMRSITFLGPRHAIPTGGRAQLLWARTAARLASSCVRGREEVGGVDAERGLGSGCPVVDLAQFAGGCREDEDGLANHGEVAAPRAIRIGLSEHLGQAGDPTYCEGRHVQLLSRLQVLAHNDRDLRIELHRALLALGSWKNREGGWGQHKT